MFVDVVDAVLKKKNKIKDMRKKNENFIEFYRHSIGVIKVIHFSKTQRTNKREKLNS